MDLTSGLCIVGLNGYVADLAKTERVSGGNLVLFVPIRLLTSLILISAMTAHSLT